MPGGGAMNPKHSNPGFPRTWSFVPSGSIAPGLAKPTTMRNVTVGAVFAIFVIATFGSVYLVRSIEGGATSSSTITSTQTSVSSPTTSVTATAASSTTQASASQSTSTETSSTSTSVTSSTTSSLSTSSTSTSSVKNSSVVGTAWFGPESFPSSCGSMSKSGTFSGDPGYTTTIYLPTGNPPGDNQYPLGSSICILVYLQNSHSQSTALPSVETVKVTSNNNSASTGLIFYEFSCSVSGSYNGSFGPNGTGWGCVATWDTSKPFNGILPTASSPDYIYEAIVTITMADSAVIQVENSLGFTT
jgi:hypothetical protein